MTVQSPSVPPSLPPRGATDNSPRRRRFLTPLFFLLLGISIYGAFWPGSGKAWVEIMVAEGSTAHRVADLLREKKMMSTPYPFLFWIKARRAEHKIHVGLYRFSSGRSAFWIVDDLIQGRTQKAKLVIPEGFATWQIAERAGELGICDADGLKKYFQEKQLEGSLAPATYELDLGLSPETVAKILVAKFKTGWTEQMESRAREIGWTQRQALTFASIIEREVRIRDELPLISAVYHNRLKSNMKLDADPTVQYALGYWKPRLTYADYRNTVSPYNTYLNKGLPPGPICSPGEDAIRAALWPASSDALFLVAQEDGRHSFSKSYREHTNKVNSRNRRKSK